MRIRWHEPLGTRGLLGVVAVALVVLVLSVRASARPVEALAGSDLTTYQRYGTLAVEDSVPYRDFDLEYPPGALAMFVLPATLAHGAGDVSWSPPDRRARRYYRGFIALVVVLLGAILVLTALTLGALKRAAGNTVLALALVACSPLLLGQVLIERFDVLPAAFVAAALATSVRGHHRAAGALLGLGAAAKFYPALLLPVVAIAAARERGRSEAIRVIGLGLAAALALYAPFAVASPADTWDSLLVQLRGGLQIETFPASVWVLASHAADALGIGAFGLAASGAGGGLIRFDLAGPGVELVRAATSVLLVATLSWLWIAFGRSRLDPREELVRYAAATVAALLVFGTILSPQYLAWLLPVVPLVGGRRGIAALIGFAVAAYLTNLWIPERYFDYQADLEVGPTSLLLARNLALLGVLVILVAPARAPGASWAASRPPSAATTSQA